MFVFFEAMWNTERVSKMLEAVQFMFEFWGKQVLKVVYFQWRGGLGRLKNCILKLLSHKSGELRDAGSVVIENI